MQLKEENTKDQDILDVTSKAKKYGDDFEFVIDPSKYKKRLTDKFDHRFASIFIVSLFFNSILIYWVSSVPYEVNMVDLKKYQEHYANFIYDKIPEPEPPKPVVQTPDEKPEEEKPEEIKNEGEVAQSEETNTETAPPVEVTARERRESNTRSTADIAQQASSMGLLALLSGGENAQGEAVVDLLGEVENGSSNNLDAVISGLDGIKSSGIVSGKNKSAKGSRATDHGGGINVGALTKVSGSKFGKKSSELVVSKSKVEAEKGKSAGRSPEEVMKVVNSHASAIEYCYQRAIRKNPSLKGKVSVRFIIKANGSVGSIKILASTLGDLSVERCIKTKVKSWRDFGAIDPAKGDAVFRQDYIFGY